MMFQAVNAKISAMRGHLFKYEDYDALCRLGTVENIGSRLREHPVYGRTLSPVAGGEIRRGIVEQWIPVSLSDDYDAIRLFIYDKPTREYLSAFFMKHELNFLKLLLCMVFDERNIPYSVSDLQRRLKQNPNVDPARLIASKTVPEFIENLQGTSIYSMLADAYGRKSSLFEMEQQMDLFYYMQLWKKQEKLRDAKEREILRRIKGTEIDLHNILWIYRLKHYYQISDARVYAYLIPINYRLKLDAVNRMIGCASQEELLAEIAGGPYGDVFADFTKPEQSYARAMRKIYKTERKRNPDSLASVIGYIFEKEQEIHNITTILECVRYELPVSEILDYVSV